MASKQQVEELCGVLGSPLQDAALRTDMWRPPGVVVEEKDIDTPSEGDGNGNMSVFSRQPPPEGQPDPQKRQPTRPPSRNRRTFLGRFVSLE